MKMTKALKTIVTAGLITSLLIPQTVFAVPEKPGKTYNTLNQYRSKQTRPEKFKSGEVIFKVNGSLAEEAKLVNKYRLSKIRRGPNGRYVLASIEPGGSVGDAVSRLKKEKVVAFVQPNYIYNTFALPNDPRLERQWGLKNINAQNTWNTIKPAKGTSGVTVAVLDTGVDIKHPDLQNRLVPGTNTVEPLKSTRDSEGHGTHIAGIISAATNNMLGVAGVAGAAPIKIMPVKVFDGDIGSDVSISNGIIWAADHGAKVINMSFGGYSKSYLLDQAIDYAYSKGIVMVAAAGNWASEEVSYPAAISKVIAVSALNKNDKLADFSSYGPLIDVSAPGDEIYSTFWDKYKGSTYVEMSGTSMASPMVAGLAALLRVKNPALTNEQVRQIMEVSATDLGEPGWDTKYGHGKINVEKALSVSLANFDDHNNNLFNAVPIKSGEPVKEKIDIGSDQDWYKITVPEKGHLQINVLPAGKVSPGLEVYDSMGKMLAAFNTGEVSNANQYFTPVSYKVAEAVHGLVTDLTGGEYYIKVFGNHFRWSDENYTMTAQVINAPDLVKDENEPNDSYDDAKSLSLGTKKSGAILQQGDQDYFKIGLNRRTYKIQIDTPPGLDLAAVLESQVNYGEETSFEGWFSQSINKGGIGEDEEGIIVLPKGGNYFITVYETSGAVYNENYTLTISGYDLKKDICEPNETWKSAYQYKVGEKITANLDRENDEDWYKIDIQETGLLEMEFEHPQNIWCDIEFYQTPSSDSGKTPVLYQNSGMAYNFNDYLSDKVTKQYKVFPGTYYFRINSPDKAIGSDYKFTTEFSAFQFIDTENNDSVDQAVELSIGKVQQGTLYPESDMDVYELNIENPQPLLVSLTPPAGQDTGVMVMKQAEVKGDSDQYGVQKGLENGLGWDLAYDMGSTGPELELVSLIDNGRKGQTDTGVFIPSKTGSYYIIVVANDGKSAGKYSLEVKPFKSQPDKWEDNGTMNKSKPIYVNSTINPSFMGIEDEDWYKIYVKESGNFEVSLTVPSDIDGILEIYNQSGQLLSKTDQSLTGEKEYTAVALKNPGYYYIKAYDYLGNSSVQPYTLVTRFKPVVAKNGKGK